MHRLLFMIVMSCFLSGCASIPELPSGPSYSFPEIGLTATNPYGWRVITEKNPPPTLPRKPDGSGVLFSMTKFRPGTPPRVSMIAVLTKFIPRESWQEIDIDAELKRSIDLERSAAQSTERSFGSFPLVNNPSIRNYSLRSTLPDFTLRMYQYFYWHPPHLVYVIATSNDDDGDRELRTILSLLKIEINKEAVASP